MSVGPYLSPVGLSLEDQARLIREVRALRDLEDVAHTIFAGPPHSDDLLTQIGAALRVVSEVRKEKR